MKFNKKLAVAVSGAVLLMAGQIALADSTTDIVDALVSKGVLTEEEGKLISKGAKSQKEAQDKSIKGKLSISSALDNATLYGDVRVRGESRSGSGYNTNISATPIDLQRDRGRYKWTLGFTTQAGDWYTDLALSSGSKGRSDNETFAGSKAPADFAPKKTVFINRAVIGWKATDWLTLEAGRMKNPLYTTPMVWDADLPLEGVVEKLNYKFGNTTVFANLGQISYEADSIADTDSGIALHTATNALLFEQFGVNFPIVENKASGKAAVTFYNYTHGGNSGAAANTGSRGVFQPGTASSTIATSSGVNNLNIFEIPAEINYMVSENIGVRLYGDYALNTDADARARNAGASYTAFEGSDDDTAWLLGFVVGSSSDLKGFESNKMKKGDWQARIWYQEVGAWALDQNLVDSDFFDSRVNTKGTVFKAQYNLADNVFTNIAYGHAKRLNGNLGMGGTAGYDIPSNLKDFDLLQLDLTYKF